MVPDETSLDQNKYENAILYLIKYCNNQYLGATKLNKLLYYFDFISYRDRGCSVTGDVYINKQYGPVPSRVDDVIADLSGSDRMSVETKPYKDGGTFNYKNLEEPDLAVFDEYETTLLQNICEEFTLWSTDKIVNQTHLEAPWFYSKPYKVVDYDYAKDIEFFAV